MYGFYKQKLHVNHILEFKDKAVEWEDFQHYTVPTLHNCTVCL